MGRVYIQISSKTWTHLKQSSPWSSKLAPPQPKTWVFVAQAYQLTLLIGNRTGLINRSLKNKISAKFSLWTQPTEDFQARVTQQVWPGLLPLSLVFRALGLHMEVQGWTPSSALRSMDQHISPLFLWRGMCCDRSCNVSEPESKCAWLSTQPVETFA